MYVFIMPHTRVRNRVAPPHLWWPIPIADRQHVTFFPQVQETAVSLCPSWRPVHLVRWHYLAHARNMRGR